MHQNAKGQPFLSLPLTLTLTLTRCVVHQNAKGQPFLSLIGRASSRASTVDLNEVMARWNPNPDPNPDH